MRIRKFTDGRGIEWRVWRAAPDPAPRNAGEYFPPDRCPGGAICFESPFERRYVLEFPEHWEQLSDAELELLCSHAQVVPIRRADEATGEFMRRQDEEFDATLRRRTFATPDNRVWMVEEITPPVSADPPAEPPEHAKPSGSEGRRVLRFSSGDAIRELDDYPTDWVRFPPGRLVELALRAKVITARPSTKHPVGEPHRRA